MIGPGLDFLWPNAQSAGQAGPFFSGLLYFCRLVEGKGHGKASHCKD
jgi:hypothetical protein